ncbi:MAG: bifunctional adenosylcobinamide kinase/adenosylcobinamide-phosphate guanylyltransferase [Pseudomonadota bacterium]
MAERQGPTRGFIATAEAWDDEMADRIDRHRCERGAGWTTMDAPLDIVSALKEANGRTDACVVDCLTLWLSNLMHAERDVEKETRVLCETIALMETPVILVSNEVGLGIVPDTPLGREFRDAQGRLNQAVAACCDHVDFMAAGLALSMKP